MTSAAPVTDAHPRLVHQAGLDGLRGAAVAAVLAFHLHQGWARGGYLGVSVFFTLSGYLITSLLLAEHSRRGKVRLLAFWSRRARRLLPAALLGLGLAVVAARFVPNGAPTAGGDIIASLADVANWRFLVSGQSYSTLFSAPSPVLHFWSLSIEEQFYLLFPLLVVATLRRSRRAFARAVVGGTLVSWAALITAGALDQRDFAYYSTLTRAGELLAGATLAIVVSRRARRAAHARAGQQTAVVGVLALIGLGALVATLAQSNRLLDLGGLPLVSLLTSAVIVAACAPGPVRTLLSWSPLAGLGKISYGVYVYHWPLFLLLTTQRTGWRGPGLIAVRLSTTLALALVSYFLVEQPIRTAQRVKATTARGLLPVAYGTLAVLALTVAVSADPAIDFNAALQQQAAAAAAAPQPTTITATPPPRIAMFGDSTALMTGLGLAFWGRQTGELQLVTGFTPLGCGIGRGGERRYKGALDTIPAGCDEWATNWVTNLAGKGADVAVVQDGEWDVSDRKLPGDTEWRHIGDPVYDDFLRGEMAAAVDLLLAQHLRVVILTAPDINVGQSDVDPPSKPYPENDPARMARFNELWREIAGTRPGVQIVDLAAHLASLPGGEMDPTLRPDGVHFTEVTGIQVAAWLGPAVVAAANADPAHVTQR